LPARDLPDTMAHMTEEMPELFPSCVRLSKFAMVAAAVFIFGGLVTLVTMEIWSLRRRERLKDVDYDFEWGRYEEVLGVLTRLPKADRRRIFVWQTTAVCLIRLGRTEEAKARLEKVLALHPNREEPRILLALACDAEGDHAEALKTIMGKQRYSRGYLGATASYLVSDLQRLMRKNNLDDPVLEQEVPRRLRWKWNVATAREVARVLMTFKQYERAIWFLEHLLATAPRDPEFLNDLAWALLTADRPELRDHQRALQLAGDAAELSGYRRPHILDTLAEAYYANGKSGKAIEWEEKAIRMQRLPRKFFSRQLEKYRASFTEKRGGSGSQPASKPSSKPTSAAILPARG